MKEKVSHTLEFTAFKRASEALMSFIFNNTKLLKDSQKLTPKNLLFFEKDFKRGNSANGR